MVIQFADKKWGYRKLAQTGVGETFNPYCRGPEREVLSGVIGSYSFQKRLPAPADRRTSSFPVEVAIPYWPSAKLPRTPFGDGSGTSPGCRRCQVVRLNVPRANKSCS
jgi:hypothetical protein